MTTACCCRFVVYIVALALVGMKFVHESSINRFGVVGFVVPELFKCKVILHGRFQVCRRLLDVLGTSRDAVVILEGIGDPLILGGTQGMDGCYLVGEKERSNGYKEEHDRLGGWAGRRRTRHCPAAATESDGNDIACGYVCADHCRWRRE